MVLQYEEIKRKFHESYFLQAQLLTSENKRLKEEITNLEIQINYLKSSPKFSVQFKADEALKDSFFTFHVESVRGNRSFNPVGNTTIENLLWDDYIITSDLKFELETETDGIILEKSSKGYLLSISDNIKEAIVIKMIVS